MTNKRSAYEREGVLLAALSAANWDTVGYVIGQAAAGEYRDDDFTPEEIVLYDAVRGIVDAHGMGRCCVTDMATLRDRVVETAVASYKAWEQVQEFCPWEPDEDVSVYNTAFEVAADCERALRAAVEALIEAEEGEHDES